MSGIFNKIKVTLEYSGRSITSEIVPYKTIKYLREITKTLFYPIQGEVNLIYQNKDITKYGQYPLGEFFKNKNQIFIKVIKQTKSVKEINRDNDYKYNLIEIEKKKEFLCLCKNDLINNYCRNCKQFICNNCRNNKFHKYHKTIQIEINNLVESTKLYAITLQSEILSNIKNSQDYDKKFQNQNFIDAFARQEIIQRKYESIYEIYKNMLNELKISENSNDNVYDEYIIKAKKENQEIENILSEIHLKYNVKKKNMTQNDFNDYFILLGKKEDKLEDMSTKIYEIKVNYEINEKLNEINNQIEKILDRVLNEKNLLGIDDSTMNIYNFILKKNRIKEDKNNKNDKNNEINNNKDEIETKEEIQTTTRNDIIEEPKKIENSKIDLQEDKQKLRKLRKVKNKDILQEAEKNQLVSMGVLNAKSQPEIILVDNIKNDNLDSNLTQNMENYINDLPYSFNPNVDKNKKLFDTSDISIIHKNTENEMYLNKKNKNDEELFLEPEEKDDKDQNTIDENDNGELL